MAAIAPEQQQREVGAEIFLGQWRAFGELVQVKRKRRWCLLGEEKKKFEGSSKDNQKTRRECFSGRCLVFRLAGGVLVLEFLWTLKWMDGWQADWEHREGADRPVTSSTEKGPGLGWAGLCRQRVRYRLPVAGGSAALSVGWVEVLVPLAVSSGTAYQHSDTATAYSFTNPLCFGFSYICCSSLFLHQIRATG